MPSCGDDAVVDAGLDASFDASSSDASSLDAGFGFDELVARYGLLETVAGRGMFGDGGFNGWEPTFEGGSATDAELSRPHMTLSDDAGNLYIADKDAHAVRRIDPDGIITTLAGPDELASPNGIWVLGDGTVYILDLGNDRVGRLDPSGELSTLFEIGGAGAGRGLWVADDESVAYVSAGTQLKRWTPTEGVSVLAAGFVSLGNVHVAPDGTLGVTDRGAHRVYTVDSDGTRTPIAGNGTIDGGGDGARALDTGLEEARGIWFHPEGGLFVATHEGNDVWFVDPEGLIHLCVDGAGGDNHAGDGEHFRSPGPKISEPRAVSMDRRGNVLITENDLGYVRRINLR